MYRVSGLLACVLLVVCLLVPISLATSISYSSSDEEHRSSINSYSSSTQLAVDGSNSTSALFVIRACEGSNCSSTSFYERDYTLSTNDNPDELQFEWNIQPYDTFTPSNSVTNLSLYNHLTSSWDVKKSVLGSLSGWELISINFSSNYIHSNGDLGVRIGGYHDDTGDYSDELGIWIREFHLYSTNNLAVDSDNDGLNDDVDTCPNGDTGWLSNSTTDFDNDGCRDSTEDDDDDNDGYSDTNDSFPLNSNEWFDFDLDGIGDNTDQDDDNDGYDDESDSFPLNTNEWFDFDLDGIGDNADIDDDNDGVGDEIDLFPLNASESTDFDLDGIGDNSDLDDDNDFYTDLDEIASGSNPLDGSETPPDFDQDRSPDSVDSDDDNDGLDDDLDLCNRYNLSNWGEREDDRTYSHRIELDRDVDGCHDVSEDYDTDQDNRTDSEDDCRGTNSSMHWDSNNPELDMDQDGCRDGVEDFDLDNDGVRDENDDFPFDECATTDSDSDGMPDSFLYPNCETSLAIDYDDDNDEFVDELDAFPLDSCASNDTDSDGRPDELIERCQTNLILDMDDDDDSVDDIYDAFPKDACAAIDTDSDGLPDTINQACTTQLDEDPDDDNDGFNDEVEDKCNTDSLDNSSKPPRDDCENGGILEWWEVRFSFPVVIFTIIAGMSGGVKRMKKWLKDRKEKSFKSN